MQLNPLPSQRFAKIVAADEKNKGFLALGNAVVGSYIIYDNFGKGSETYRVYNLVTGFTFLTIAAQKHFSRSTYTTDNIVLSELNLKGAEKELSAYFLLKSYAEKNKAQRKTTGSMLIASALASAVLANVSPSISQTEKNWISLSAVGFVGMGLYHYFWPTEIEVSADQMMKELN